MCGLILAASLLFLCPDVAELSLGAHNYSVSAPEIQGIGNPVFVGSVQWKLAEYGRHSLMLAVDHTSGVSTFERGFGLNTINVRYRYERD